LHQPRAWLLEDLKGKVMLVDGVKPNAFERARAPEPSLDVSIFSAAEQIHSALAFVGPVAPSTRIPKKWGEECKELRPPAL
jgi:hypothetical protein